MHKYFVLALGLLAACAGTGKDSGDTSTTTDTDTTGGPTAPVINSWTASCLDEETFEGTVDVSGDSNGVHVLNIWETGAPDASAWNEEHDITGSTITLTQVASPDDITNETSLFGCGTGEQFDLDETTLTYAVRVYDTDGVIADCIQFGHEPETVSGGTYTTIGGAPSSPGEFTDCRTLN